MAPARPPAAAPAGGGVLLAAGVGGLGAAKLREYVPAALAALAQAEIDKFIGLVTLNQGAYRSSGAELCSWLFDHVSFESNLDDEDRHRYEVANFYAGHYCRQLSHRYLQSQDGAGLTRELRRFYRQGQHGKLDMIQSG